MQMLAPVSSTFVQQSTRGPRRDCARLQDGKARWNHFPRSGTVQVRPSSACSAAPAEVRESDDALGCAVRGNEHLREQIEEQMQRYQEMNAKDLAAANAQSPRNEVRGNAPSNTPRTTRL